MKSILKSALLGLALAVLAVGASAQATKNPELGTWKLNVEKSKYNPGPAPKSNTVTMEAAGNGVKYSAKGVDAEGKPTATEYTASYDGKDIPLKGSNVADATSTRRIDAWTVERITKKDGKVVSTIRREYAKDGKSFTAKVTGKNAKGEAVNNVLFYDRM